MTTWWEGEKQGAWNLGKGEGMGEREAPQDMSNTPPPTHTHLKPPSRGRSRSLLCPGREAPSRAAPTPS